MPYEKGSRPHLFLDVDGVLNAFELLPGRNTHGFDDFDVHEVTFEDDDGSSHNFIVVLSPTMGARLAALAADITWATTWEHRANSYIAPLCGLPRGLPVLTEPDHGAAPWGRWKFQVVRRAVESDPRPFAWVDDDIDSFRTGSITARNWAASISTPNLLIAPDPQTGLLPEQLELVETFLADHRDWSC